MTRHAFIPQLRLTAAVWLSTEIYTIFCGLLWCCEAGRHPWKLCRCCLSKLPSHFGSSNWDRASVFCADRLWGLQSICLQKGRHNSKVFCTAGRGSQWFNLCQWPGEMPKFLQLLLQHLTKVVPPYLYLDLERATCPPLMQQVNVRQGSFCRKYSLLKLRLWVQEAALKSRWLPIDHEDATRMIHLLDRDRNGMVSYEEFRSFAYLLPESQVSLS